VLTAEQVRFYETFGFLVVKEAFSPAEIAAIGDSFDQVLDEDRWGNDFPGDERQEVQGFLEQRADLYRLLEDDRIFTSVEQLLGPGFVWIGSDGNLYVGDTRWHRDSQESYQRVKVAFYLDPVDEDTGCLRVMPGSHLPGMIELLRRESWPDAEPALSGYRLPGRDLPYFPLVSEPGDLVFFSAQLFHASYGGANGRRMFALRFGAKPSEPAHYAHLRWSYEHNLEKAAKANSRYAGTPGFVPRDRVYSEEFFRSDSPRIRSMVAELVELGFR